MKATITRYVDDLGRVVIPKEIRQQVGVKEGSMLEIYVNDSGDVVLHKHQSISEVSIYIEQIKSALMDNEATEDIREETFRQLHKVEDLIKSVGE